MLNFPEYHQFVFEYCQARYGKDIRYHLVTKPLRVRLEFFQNTICDDLGRVTSDHLKAYLTAIEARMSDLLSTHSPFFWIFLYRRIKPTLSKEHDDKIDGVTTLLVRHVVELAIAKFGNLTNTDDIKRTSQTTFSKCWGSILAKAVNTAPKNVRENIRSIIIKDFETNDSFNPDSFTCSNYRDIFEVEGLGYEYWLCTARLRSVGKGSRLHFDRSSGEFFYDRDSELHAAIDRYDERIGGNRFFSTLIGVVSDVRTIDDVTKSLFLLQYNVNGHDVAPILKLMGLNVASANDEPISNFVPWFMGIKNFIEAHSYLNAEFLKRWGFSFEDLAWVLWALSNVAFVPNIYLETRDQPLGHYFLRILKRGYSIYKSDGEPSYGFLRDRLIGWMKLDAATADDLVAKAPKVFEMISLTPARQAQISLWSGGPKPVLLPYGDAVVIDVASIAEFLRRAFTGIRDDGKMRGDEFEETVRRTIVGALPVGFQVGPRRIREGGALIDEIDLLLQNGDTVYVCECFSMWRPLNYEIGDEKTITGRLTRIDEKLDQAKETCCYLDQHRTGAGYDYGSVREFVPIVVSPFVEWLPSTSERYWISEKIPRVMSLDELSAHIESL